MPGKSRSNQRRRAAIVKMSKRTAASWVTCRCGKRGYKSEADAMDVAFDGVAGRRVYWCETGGMWHLTSKRAYRQPPPQG